MPLAAFAQWQGDLLVLRAALGHPERTESPLLRVTVQGAVADEASARALGVEAAELLRGQGAAAYLAS
jgi:hydroxymethylbilane synthase